MGSRRQREEIQNTIFVMIITLGSLFLVLLVFFAYVLLNMGTFGISFPDLILTTLAIFVVAAFITKYSPERGGNNTPKNKPSKIRGNKSLINETSRSIKRISSNIIKSDQSILENPIYAVLERIRTNDQVIRTNNLMSNTSYHINKTCIICYKIIDNFEISIRTSCCAKYFHYQHFILWVNERKSCPFCRVRISKKEYIINYV